METISELKSKAAELRKIADKLDELRKIADKLDEAANALAGLTGHEESWPLEESAEEVARPSVVTSAEPEVGLIEAEQPVREAAYRKDGPDGQLALLAEPISESSAGLAVEQTVESSPPDIRQTPNGASPSAVLPKPHQMERRTEPSDQEIRLRAYFFSERRRRFALPGDADSDWHEAKRQLLCESGELGGLSTITAGESGRILRAAGDLALPVTVASAKPRVESIEQPKDMRCETTSTEIQSSAAEAIPEPASNFPSATANESVSPQVTTTPTMPEHPEMTEVPAAPLMKTPTAEHVSRPASSMHTAVQLTFSLEIASMQLTPAFEVGALQVRTTSKIVTMRLAPHQGSQPGTNPEVSFKIAKIQPAGGAFGNIRMTPSQQQKPTAVGSPSFMVEGSQLVPNFEGTSVQLTPSQQAEASVLVTVPFEINTIEFSPSFAVASVVLNSSSKQVFVQLPGAQPSPGEGRSMFEIANLELSESGDISMMQLNLSDHSSNRT